MLDCMLWAVEDLIPHSPPMVLLDRVLHYDSDSLTAEVTIRTDSLYYDDAVGGVPGWVGIEYMAQAIAALAGLHARENNHAVHLGYLLGTRHLTLARKVLRAGQRYHVQVNQLIRDASGLANFDCRILHEESLCVAARINVFVSGKLTKPGTAARSAI